MSVKEAEYIFWIIGKVRRSKMYQKLLKNSHGYIM